MPNDKKVNHETSKEEQRLKIIINTVHTIFNEPFKQFYIYNKTNKNIEETAIELNNSINKCAVYAFKLLVIAFIIVLILYIKVNFTKFTPKYINTLLANYEIILAIICIAISLIIQIVFFIITFIYLWKFVNKNTIIMYK
ncbi:MAG: hypothetical protein IJ848_00925 [Alphaproteobacteria bacterium]|nr:hypothetical protein [Alphaproteobacteria bacterium]